MSYSGKSLSRRQLCGLLALGGAAMVTAACRTKGGPGKPTNPADTEPHPQPAVEGIVSALQNHPIVAIGETHGSLDLHGFLLRLVGEQRFRTAVQDIAVEVGASAQPVIDAYLNQQAADEVLLDALRDSIFSESGAADPRTLDLYRAVREANATLAAPQRMRVLAADAPLSWKRVPASDTFHKDRESAMADVLGAQVLDRGRRALWIVGGAHLGKSAARGALERRNPKALYVLSLYTGFGARTRELESRTAGWPVPGVVPVAGSWLETVDTLGNPGAPGDVMVPDGPSGGAAQPPDPQPMPQGSAPPPPPAAAGSAGSLSDVDALLFLGRCGALRPMVPPRSVFADPAYAAELNRRSRAMWGRDFDVDAHYRFAESLFGGTC